MRNNILMLPLLGLATVSYAQSGITVQGTVDIGLSRVIGSETSRTGLISGGNSTSKLIFRGREDLGGGLYAMFWMEAGFNANDGTFHATNTNNQPSGAVPAGGMTFNRRNIVGFGGPWGEIHLGREQAPNYEMYTSKFDPFGLGLGVAINYKDSLAPRQIRASNDIAYLSPKFFGGFSVNLQHWRGNNAGGSATSDDGNGSGGRLSYDNGPMSAAVAYMRTLYATGDATYRTIAGAYDFGMARLTFIGTRNEQGTLKESGWLLGVTAPVGPALLKASYSTLAVDRPGDPEGKKYAVGLVYDLSKRTAVYSTVATVRNSGGARYAMTGATTAPNRSSSGFELGLRHNF